MADIVETLRNSPQMMSADGLRFCAEAAAKQAALELDAARYRWLREQAIDGAPGVPVIAMPNGMKSGYYLNFDTADYAIDAAMKG